MFQLTLVIHQRRRYQNNSLYKLNDIISWITENNKKISKLLNIEDDELLVDINFVFDVILKELESGNKEVIAGVNEFFLFIQGNQSSIISVLQKVTENDEVINDVKGKLNSLRWILKDFFENERGLKVESFISDLRSSDKTDFSAFQKWFKASSSKYICTDNFCQENKSFKEVEGVLTYLLENRGDRLFSSINYLGNEGNENLQNFISKIFSSLTVN